MLPVELNALAEQEMYDAAAYYRSQGGEALALAFLAELGRLFEVIARLPGVGAAADATTRRHPLNRFPYSVIYREKADHIRVLAIASQHRKPTYWQRRG